MVVLTSMNLNEIILSIKWTYNIIVNIKARWIIETETNGVENLFWKWVVNKNATDVDYLTVTIEFINGSWPKLLFQWDQQQLEHFCCA